MSDVDEGDADPLLECLQLDLQRAAKLGVECSERLVEQQHRRVQHERPGERDTLLLAARELAGAPLLVAGELHELERFSHPGRRSCLASDLYCSPKATFSATVRNGNRA